MTVADKRTLINKDHRKISVSRQGQLLGISRSGIYYEPVGISEADKRIMDIIDKIYTAHPYYGTRRIQAELNYTHLVPIGRDQVRTFMKKMGLQALYPKARLNMSQPNQAHTIYPYLLRGVPVIRPNHVWSTDITYIRVEHGFAYLTAIIDWFSRYVISWKLSNSLEIDFCLECLNEALCTSKHRPEIFNSDQGSQFTSKQFTNILQEHEIHISMDGRGRCLDNVFVERLWRSVKQEKIYLNTYQDVQETRTGLDEYFPFYNKQRRHQSLNRKTPAQIYFA